MPSLQDGGDWGRALFPGFHPGLYSFAPSGSEVREPWESWYPTLAKETEARTDGAPSFAEAEEAEYVVGFRCVPIAPLCVNGRPQCRGLLGSKVTSAQCNLTPFSSQRAALTSFPS
jgi:hypothetical protein